MPRTSTPERAALTREQVVEGALALVERDGFAALSMRRVAAELDVGTMSLYWHVATKDDLVDLMFDRAIREQLLDEVPADWRTGLEQIALGARRAFELHPWLIDAGPRLRLGPRLLEHVEQSLTVAEHMGVSLVQGMAAVEAVDAYVLGYVVAQHTRPANDVPALTETATERLEAGAYPRYRAALASGTARQQWVAAQNFATGLGFVLDGIALAVERGGRRGRRRRSS